MRMKHDLGSLEAPRNLLLSKKATQEVLERIPSEKRSGRTVSPETKSHRFQHGWQHLHDTPENILNNNNNNADFGDVITANNNEIDKVEINQNNHNIRSDISNLDDDDNTVFPSPPISPKFQQPKCDDDGYDNNSHNNDSEDSDDTSSDDEDTSISFSDTSPLLDVSSLDEDSSSDSESDDTTSSSSNDISDAEMSDDDADCLAEADDNLDNNNSGGEESSSEKTSSMDSPSWMTFSSPPSLSEEAVSSSKKAPPPSPSITSVNNTTTSSHRADGLNKRNGVVLPDVLPVVVPELDDDEAIRERRELEIQLKRRELKLDATPRISRDCCIVEITTQPDIHVDIRLNPTLERPFPEPYMKQRNSYPREAAKNYNFYFKSRDVEPQCSTTTKTVVQSAIGPSNSHDKSSPRYFTMGEGVRLNNYTIVNGFNAVSLTEVVKAENHVQANPIQDDESFVEMQPGTNFLRNGRHKSIDNRSFNIDSHFNGRRYPRPKSEVLEQNPYADVVSCMNSLSLRSSEKHDEDTREQNQGHHHHQYNNKNTEQLKKLNSSSSSRDACCQVQPSQLPYNQRHSGNGDVVAPKNCSPVKSSNGRKLPSPELFEVFTMESATSHINWSAARNHRENEWLKKRQNDREEIRRKLAMDSDNEDHVIDKRNASQDATAVDRLKCGTNLQMCFYNEEAANGKFKDDDDEEGAKPNNTSKVESVPQKPPLPRILKKNALFPPSLRKNSMNSPKTLNNNNTTETVTKRQRPAFFFNRPRSWHAAKVEEKHYPTEDLFTCHQRLQEEAREALAQAKEMARMQMEIERQKKKKSPIADIVGFTFPDGHNLLSRNALVEMNVAQLQVIVNDLHSQIETLNDDLVKFLLERDDLHMEQDSMLVDIEDLTRYLGLKGNTSITQPSESKFSGNSVSNCGDNNKKLLKVEPVRRSQSVHLKKSKNFVWPWHRHSVFNCTYSQG